MHGVGCAKAKYVIFIEPVFYNQACARAPENRKKNTMITFV